MSTELVTHEPPRCRDAVEASKRAGEAGEEGQCLKEVVHSLITAKKGASSQLQLSINSSLKLACMARSRYIVTN